MSVCECVSVCVFYRAEITAIKVGKIKLKRRLKDKIVKRETVMMMCNTHNLPPKSFY